MRRRTCPPCPDIAPPKNPALVSGPAVEPMPKPPPFPEYRGLTGGDPPKESRFNVAMEQIIESATLMFLAVIAVFILGFMVVIAGHVFGIWQVQEIKTTVIDVTATP